MRAEKNPFSSSCFLHFAGWIHLEQTKYFFSGASFLELGVKKMCLKKRTEKFMLQKKKNFYRPLSILKLLLWALE
jgi:hypothetical protein